MEKKENNMAKKKPWEGRFSKSLDKDVQEFNNSISFDKKLASYDVFGSIIHVSQLSKVGLIEESESALIIKYLTQIKADVEQDNITFLDEFEDVHMNIEHILNTRMEEDGLLHIAGKLHTARSRNDQVALDTKLYLKDCTVKIIETIKLVISAIDGQIEDNQGVRIPGYTHLQKAQPILLSTHLNCWQEMLKRDVKRFKNNLELINYSPLGAGALAGTTLNLDREFTAKELGFAGVVENTMDSVSDRDYVMDFCSACATFMIHLSRICEELILWSTSEFKFIHIDDAYATGSSLMPNKKNPDVPELIRGKSGRVVGNLTSILVIMKSLPLAYNKDMQEDKEIIFDNEKTVIQCGFILSKFIANITFNLEKLAQDTKSDFISATYIVDELVAKKVPFRDAHHIVGNIVKYCNDNNKDLWDLTLEEAQNFNPHLDRDMKTILSKYYK